MSKSLGDFDASTVVYGKFTTYRPSTGAPHTLAGTPALSVYKDNSTTQSTMGVTLTVDFDSVTGFHHYAIDTSADGAFYAAGSFFDIVVTTGTVDSVSAVGTVVGSFTLRKTSALKPTTAGRELDVSAGGEAGIDWANIGSPTTTVNLSGTTTLVVGSVTGAVGSVTGNVGGNVVGSTASVTGNVGGNVVGTVASVVGAVGSVTGNVGGNVVGSVASVTGAVGSVTGNVGGSVGSVTGLTTATIATAVLTTAMTESYNTDGAAPTLAQALFVTMQRLTEFAISSSTITVKKLDGSTTAYTLTMDAAASSATSSTRSA